MGLISKLLGGGTRTQGTTVGNPLRIRNPTLGFLNLRGAPGANEVELDHRILAPLFSQAQTASDTAPRCSVLFVYATLGRHGNIEGQTARIRDLARQAGAYVVVLASDNAAECYMQALKPKGDWHANFTLTLDRKGERLAAFFRGVFGAMFGGESMLIAWAKLAPQIPGREDPNAPSTLMAAEAGHITFTV